MTTRLFAVMTEGETVVPESAMAVRRVEASKAARQKISEKRSQMGIGWDSLSNHTLCVDYWPPGSGAFGQITHQLCILSLVSPFS